MLRSANQQIAKKILKHQLKLYSATTGTVTNSTSQQSQQTRLLALITAYSQCRQWQPHEQIFADQVAQVQRWQASRVTATHQAILEDPDYALAAEFLLKEAYQGADLSLVMSQIESAVPYFSRLFPRKLLATVEQVLMLNLITAQLDEALAETIFEREGTDTITEYAYIKAFLVVGGVDLRHQQLNLMVELMQSIEGYMKNKWLMKAFKWAKTPAYSAGCRSLYDFLAKGLYSLKSINSPLDLVSGILEIEFQINQRIAQGHISPFHFDSESA